jgi:hypothetical protein
VALIDGQSSKASAAQKLRVTKTQHDMQKEIQSDPCLTEAPAMRVQNETALLHSREKNTGITKEWVEAMAAHTGDSSGLQGC